MNTILNLVGYILFLGAASYYFITNLQWYSYKLERVVLHHTKWWWHFVYFIVPYALYETLAHTSSYAYIVAFVYAAMIVHWYKGLDKPLVWTARIKRFWAAVAFIALFLATVTQSYVVVFPIFIGWFVSVWIEKILFAGYKRKAKEELEARKDLIVVGVTASYGKTSIKNFIAHLLSENYKVYATPRSVNTLGGVIKDINEDLPEDCEVYVVEMGARNPGDIAEIATFVNPQITVVGKIGPAHIEYFKTLEAIRNTKMEILQSARLQKAYVHISAHVRTNDTVETYGMMPNKTDESETLKVDHIVSDVEATLEKTCFKLDDIRYCAKILGAFNAENIAAAILVAQRLGVDEATIAERVGSLKSVAHRLQRIDAGGKIILDDSFNGNIDGMRASFALVSGYEGRKVLVTPGLVEADEALNEEVAELANEIFDVVIVTSDLNEAIFKRYVDADKLHKLEHKAQMERMLAETTRSGDLILFANDAPSFV